VSQGITQGYVTTMTSTVGYDRQGFRSTPAAALAFRQTEVGIMPGGSRGKPLSKPGTIGCLLVFAIAFSGFSLGFDAVIAWGAFRQVRGLRYARTTGVMTQSEVEEVPDTDGPSTYRPKLRYTYSVAGKDYVGDRYRYGRWATSAGWATQIVASHPVGARVEVHYAPADPSDAVLKVGVEGMDLFLAMFLLPFNLVSLAFCIALGRAFSHRPLPPRFGRADFSGGGVGVPGWFSPWRPLYTGGVVAGVLALIGTFGIGFTFGGAPPLPVMLVAWGVILGGGTLGYALHRRRLNEETGDQPGAGEGRGGWGSSTGATSDR
jgi:hypothetical protein